MSSSQCGYKIVVETGSQKRAGTCSSITVVVIGTEGRTGPIPLDKSFHNDLIPGQLDEYHVTGNDVGVILSIEICNNRKYRCFQDTDWLLNRLILTNTRSSAVYEFPCYRWVVSSLVLYRGKALLPQQNQHDVIRKARNDELRMRQAQYQWKQAQDMPGHILAADHTTVPRDSQMSDESSASFWRSRREVVTNVLLTARLSIGKEYGSFEEFTKPYTCLIKEKQPELTKNESWKDDVVFGEHVLNGANPMSIERCNELPEGFPVTHGMVGNLLDRGLTLDQEIQRGHVYIVNHEHLTGVRRRNQGTKNQQYVCEPLALFYVRASGDLVPLAIQFYQEHSDTNPIWTPNDAPLDWLFAKMWFRNADVQITQIIIHLLRTHIVTEPVAIATWRQLPSIHPVHRLLFPHVRSILSINTLNRTDLINEGGIVDQLLSIGGGGHYQLLQEYYREHFTMSLLSVPEDLRRRGVDDRDKLPGYYYRDDALALWDALMSFIRDFMSLYYSSDEDITQDTELQTWAKDIAENGFPRNEGHIDHDFPSSITSRDQLVRLLTSVVFTCTCQHAAVSFSAFELLSFSPNTPCTMRRPPPTKKGTVTMKMILETLPQKREAALFLGVMYVISRNAPDEKFLGDYSGGLFTDHEADDVIASFQEKLQEISAVIKERNDDLVHPYECLLPEGIPNSIAI